MNSSSEWQTSYSTIQEANLHLLKTAKFSDVVFLVGQTKVKIHAHKLILMARSPVFEVMFERWETEKKCSIEIPEITSKSFRLFLTYLYSNTFAVTGEEAAEVLYLAHKYGSNDLAKLCSDFLKSVINTGNVIHIHQVASRLDQVALRTQAMDFILRNGKSVFQDIGFLGIDFETLSVVLKSDELAVDELAVFRAVMRWSENRCYLEKLDNTAKNKRNILKNILNLIRFPLMRSEDFTEDVVRKNKGILTDAETIGIYMDFSTVSSNEIKTTIPFSRNRRRSPDTYSVEPYVPRSVHFQNSSCRQHYGANGGANFQCISTLTFSSSENIYLNGIELHGFQDCLALSEFAATSEFTILIKPSRGFDMTVSNTTARVTSEQMKKLLTPSSIKIKFENEISILKSEQYEIKISFSGATDRSRRVKSMLGKLAESTKVICGSNNTTLSFVSEITQCGCPRNFDFNMGHPGGLFRVGPACLSSGQIKAIYFTL